MNGYSFGVFAPGFKNASRAPYTCGLNILKCHTEAYRLYEQKYKETQQGRVGITLDYGFSEPKDPQNPDDQAASQRVMEFKVTV